MRIKSTPEDFVVEEIPAYEPSGSGAHLYVRFRKRGLTTHDAVGSIARALGVHPRDVGVPGLKDKIAVTTQTISVPWSADVEGRVASLAIDGISVLGAARHGNKLKTGHLHGNRFTIVIRDVPAERRDEVIARFRELGTTGVPNAFGEQRFGRDGDNAERARAALAGKGAWPKDARLKRLMFSALQSAVFNEVLARRVADGTWTTCLEGDLVKRRDSGGMFVCTDVQADRERAARGEVSPTGPVVGVEMRWPEGAPRALEEAVFAEIVGDRALLEGTGKLGQGTRRALRLFVEDMQAEPEQDHGVRVYFVLPKGAYATTVLAAALGGTPEGSDPHQPGVLREELHD